MHNSKALILQNDNVVMSTHNAASWGYFDTVEKSWNEQVPVSSDTSET